MNWREQFCRLRTRLLSIGPKWRRSSGVDPGPEGPAVFKTASRAGAIQPNPQTGGSDGIRTNGPLRVGSLANCWNNPLSHASRNWRPQRVTISFFRLDGPMCCLYTMRAKLAESGAVEAQPLARSHRFPSESGAPVPFTLRKMVRSARVALA